MGRKKGEKKREEKKGRHKKPFCTCPFLILFLFCTEWIDMPFTLLNSAIESIYTANEQQRKIPGAGKV